MAYDLATMNDLIEKEGYFFVTTVSSLPVLLIRHPRLQHWCGYSGVPANSPLAAHYDSPIFNDIDVHGGLTFSGDLNTRYDNPDQPTFFLGFDCAHADDYSPGLHAAGVHIDSEIYRDKAYALSEATFLAAQLSTKLLALKST